MNKVFHSIQSDGLVAIIFLFTLTLNTFIAKEFAKSTRFESITYNMSYKYSIQNNKMHVRSVLKNLALIYMFLFVIIALFYCQYHRSAR